MSSVRKVATGVLNFAEIDILASFEKYGMRFSALIDLETEVRDVYITGGDCDLSLVLQAMREAVSKQDMDNRALSDEQLTGMLRGQGVRIAGGRDRLTAKVQSGQSARTLIGAVLSAEPLVSPQNFAFA